VFEVGRGSVLIPIGDSLPTRRRPLVNVTIIFLTLLAFLFELSLGAQVDRIIYRWGATPLLITRALAHDPRVPSSVLWTLVTSQFLHAGWMHLLGNMLFLWVFGDNVEERFGHFGYLLFYLVAGTVAGLVQVYASPSSTVPLIGASGAIAGVLGAYLMFWPSARVSVLFPVFFLLVPLEVPVVFMLGIWFLTQLSAGLATISVVSQATGGIAFWAHVGGFIFGAVAAVILPTRAPARSVPIGAGLGAARPSRGAGWLIHAVNFAGNVIQLLILFRLAFGLLGLGQRGPLGPLVRLVAALTWPLVQPFSHLLPIIQLDGSLLELYAVLALVVYHLLLAALIWALSAPTRGHLAA